MRIRHATKLSENEGRILYLDDDNGAIDALRYILERDGFYVDSTTTPNEAIEMLKNNKHDVFILDYYLGGTNGDEVMAQVRGFSGIYSIILTGHSDLLPPMEALRRLNVQGYAAKSDNFDCIRVQVQTAINSLEYVYDFISNSRFKDILKMLMDKSNIGADELKDALNVRHGTILDWLSGKSTPGYETLIGLTKEFKVSTDLLLGRIFQKW